MVGFVCLFYLFCFLNKLEVMKNSFVFWYNVNSIRTEKQLKFYLNPKIASIGLKEPLCGLSCF